MNQAHPTNNHDSPGTGRKGRITMYDVVKVSGVWRVRALSACFPPIVISSPEYPTKAQAVRAARDAAGCSDGTITQYKAILADYKRRHGID